MNLGVARDPALRATNLAFFLISGLVLYGLLRRVSGRLVAGAALIAFVFSPFAVVWSRTAMIEYLATAAAIGFVWAGIVWRDTRRVVPAVVAVLVGVVAMTVKLTTGLFWMLPLLLYVSKDELAGVVNWVKTRVRPAMCAVFGLPLLAGWLWTRHADSIKAASRATSWLTSSALTQWNFGTLSQRLDLANWSTIGERVDHLLFGAILWVPLALGALWMARRSGFWLGWVLATVLPVLVFFNLYVVHDYYLAAISPGVAGCLGVGAAWLLRQVPRSLVSIVAMVLVLLWVGPTTWARTDYVRAVYPDTAAPLDVLPYSHELSTQSTRGDRVVVDNFDWNPSILYYADREGMMLAPKAVYPGLFGHLRRSGYRVWMNLAAGDKQLVHLTEWPWVGVRSQHVYRLGETSGDVDGARVVATTDERAVPQPAGDTQDGADVTLRCGDPSDIPLQAATDAWLVPVGALPADFRLVIDDLAPLPAFAGYRVRAGRVVTLSCTGTDQITFRTITLGRL